MEFFHAFGVSWKSLLAQFVNFAILLVILQKLAYKPLLKFMEERNQRIAKGVEEAKEAQKALQSTREEQERLLAQARKEATELIDAARKSADAQAASIVAQAKAEVSKVIAQGKVSLQQERERMLQEVKKDVIGMVITSAEKILTGVVDEKVDQKWVKSQLERVKS